MDKVCQCIDDVERKLTKIDKMTAKGANKLTVKDVLKMAQKGNSINATIKKGIKNYNGVDPTNQEAEEILAQMTRIVELEEKQMDFACENKPTFDKLKIGGIIKANLKKSEAGALDLAAALIAKSPAHLKKQGEALDARAKASFDKTMKLYSNASGGEDQITDKVDDSD